MNKAAAVPVRSSPETRAFVSKAQELLRQLAILIRNAHYHDLANEVFDEPLENFQTSLESFLQQEREFRLERLEHELFANGTRLRMELRSLTTYKFLWNELSKSNIGGLLVSAALSRTDLAAFLSILTAVRPDAEDAAEQINELLIEKGVENLRALPPREWDTEELSGQEIQDRRERALHTYQQTLDFIRKSMAELDSPAEVNQRQAKRMIHRLVDLSYEEGDGFSLVGLASIKDHDNYTFNHMVNVCVLAIAFGQRLGLARRELAELGMCALYHDMGKLHIPADLLRKHGALTEQEWALMGNHTVFAARTLFPLVRRDPGVVKQILAALQHHLGYDGKGYPKLRVLRRQSLYARIIAIVDAFDAMTTKRVYQELFLPDAALRRIREYAGNYCDPLLVKAFINCMGIFPVGSTVQLATGELAVVVESNSNPKMVHQPRVKVITDAAKQPREPALVDLSQPSEQQRPILNCVDPEAYGINSAYYVV